jgi:polyhydroxyalkanoate synthesis regulator phasin
MRNVAKKFFLLGLGVAAAGVAAGLAYKNKAKVKKTVNELVKKGKLMKKDATLLSKELVAELKKFEKSHMPKKKRAKK